MKQENNMNNMYILYLLLYTLTGNTYKILIINHERVELYGYMHNNSSVLSSDYNSTLCSILIDNQFIHIIIAQYDNYIFIDVAIYVGPI